MEELELDATNFWRQFDNSCRASYRDKTTSVYERVSLLVLFIWVSQRDSTLLQEHDLDPLERRAMAWWTQALLACEQQLRPAHAQLLDVGAVPEDFLSRVLHFFRQTGELSHRTAAYFFDYRFMRLAEREAGRSRLISHFSASLANTLIPQKSYFIDTFCETGDLFATGGNERWRRSPSSASDAYIFQDASFDLELRMRLSLHEKGPRTLRNLSFGERPSRGAFFRVDLPARKSLVSMFQGTRLKSLTNSLQALRLIQEDFGADTVLVITAGSERTASRQSFQDIRRSLLEHENIVAVIDFPKTPGVRTERTAWLVRSRPTSQSDTVLMINTAAIPAPANRQEYGALAEFCGRIVKTFLGEIIPSRWATSSHEDSAAHYRHLFDREFADGYRDIDGLCRLVSAREIERNGYRLQAQLYVQPVPNGASLSGIDGTPLVDLLRSSRNQGRTIYLIGNNGEGKSLLLRELAQFSNMYYRKIIGISCSVSDRFPLDNERSPGFDNFIYDGARTSDQATNLAHFATDVCRKFINIHRSPERLHLFDDILGLIDFNARRYLMPLKAGGSNLNRHPDWIMGQTIEVGSDASKNKALTGNINPSTMQIALMRSDSHGGITPFRNLSSGEQQIVSLVVKLIAHAENNCLFLIDEPEISLHVSWQRVLPSVLSAISQHFECDIIVATHSPLLISSVYDGSSICLSTSKQRLTQIDQRDLRSVESVLFNGFRTHTTNNRLIHERCATIVAEAIGIMNCENPEETKLQQLLYELSSMRRRVREASGQLDKSGIDRSLEVIRTAREAIQQLTNLRPHSPIEESST
ncbi:AAA family ATPase [Stenotrophomonas maltophilia]|uniref:AAA family ATPase n=1 Tax=Stenotrophomonas maltophilia TaxID=40324 RepID=UPI0034E2DED9